MRSAFAVVVVAAAAFCAPARAQCHWSAVYLPMSCSIHQVRLMNVGTASALLGGSCPTQCYTCGAPTGNETQTGPEEIFTFQCQMDGDVTLALRGQTCDFDFYVLGDTCNPSTGCLAGNTRRGSLDSELTFSCIVGHTYYVVVEAYGATADASSDICSGGVWYTLDAVLGPTVTGCRENCHNNRDDDLNGLTDCQDPACRAYSGEGFCAPGSDGGTDAGVPDGGTDGGDDGFGGGGGGGPTGGGFHIPGTCSCTAAGAPLTVLALVALVRLSRLRARAKKK